MSDTFDGMKQPSSPTHRVCTLCEATCGIRVHSDAGRPTRIEPDPDDPFSKGHICPKAHGLLDLQRDPDRLRTPMRRTESGFEPIGWDEALDLAAERLGAIRDESGADAVALYRGNPTSHDAESLLYWNALQTALPSRSRFSAGPVDTWPRWVQAGEMYGGFLHTPVPDLERTRYLLILGANPLVSNGSLMTAPGMKKRLAAIQARGGRIVVVDPRRTETADEADEHLPIRPGADAAFLLALVHTLTTEGAAPDLGRCEGWVSGLDEVVRIAARFTPERVAAVCGLEAETIRRIAIELREAPNAVVYGRMGTSVQTLRHPRPLGHRSAQHPHRQPRSRGRRTLPEAPPVSPGLRGTEPRGPAFRASAASEESRLGLRRGPRRMARWPRSRKRSNPSRDDRIRALVDHRRQSRAASRTELPTGSTAALERLEFMVAFDYYVNETTRHADLILPPT